MLIGISQITYVLKSHIPERNVGNTATYLGTLGKLCGRPGISNFFFVHNIQDLKF